MLSSIINFYGKYIYIFVLFGPVKPELGVIKYIYIYTYIYIYIYIVEALKTKKKYIAIGKIRKNELCLCCWFVHSWNWKKVEKLQICCHLISSGEWNT